MDAKAPFEAPTTPSGGGIDVRSLAAVPAVVLAGAVVAVAAAGLRLVVPAVELTGIGTWIVRGFGTLLIAGGIGALLAQRPALVAVRGRGPDPTAAAIRTAGALMGALAILSILTMPSQSVQESTTPGATRARLVAPDQPDGGGETVTRRVPEGQGRGAGMRGPAGGGSTVGAFGEGIVVQASDAEPNGGLFQLAMRAMPLALLLATLALVYLIATGRLARRSATDFVFTIPLDPVEARAGLEASLEEILRATPGDARDPITAAYQRLLHALDEAGASRRAHEGPHEHLYRALGPLGVPPGPLHRLTDLYVEAQFGARPMTEGQRAAASEALRASLDSLRAARAGGGAVAR